MSGGRQKNEGEERRRSKGWKREVERRAERIRIRIKVRRGREGKERERLRRKGKSKMVTSFQKLVSRTKEKQLGESRH